MSHADATTTQAALEASGMAVTRIFDRGYVLLVRSPDGRYQELRTQADVKRAEQA